MWKLDYQEEKIVKALIRNPKLSDNAISRQTDIPVMTVNRKRKKMESKGLISYFLSLNMGPNGTGRFGARHLYLIKFKLGVSQDQIIKEIMEEPKVRSVFTDFIFESHIAEIDGHTALGIVLEGKDNDEVSTMFNTLLIPSLENNHGKDSIDQVSTIRIGKPIRIFHNYLPMINMKDGIIKNDWESEAIFVE